MFGKLLNELRDIRTRFYIVRDPGEASTSIVFAERLNDLSKTFIVERPKDTVRVTWPSPKAASCSSDVSALRIPPSA